VKDEDYVRMDGSTGAQSRKRFTTNFNDASNERFTLFPVSFTYLYLLFLYSVINLYGADGVKLLSPCSILVGTMPTIKFSG